MGGDGDERTEKKQKKKRRIILEKRFSLRFFLWGQTVTCIVPLPSTRQINLFFVNAFYSQANKAHYLFLLLYYYYKVRVSPIAQAQTLTKRRGSMDSRWASNKKAPTIGIAPAKTIAQWYDPPDAETIADAIGVPSMLPITIYSVTLIIHEEVVEHMFSRPSFWICFKTIDNIPFERSQERTYQRGCQNTTSQPQKPIFQPPQPRPLPQGTDSQNHLH